MTIATTPLPVEEIHPGELPPGPRLPRMLVTLAWELVPTTLLDRCASRFGEAFTLYLSDRSFVVVSNPEAVKTLFRAPPEVVPSAAGNSTVAPILGPSSVITLAGPEHMRQRKLLLPPFHGERMHEYEKTIVEATRREMASWALGTPLRLHNHTRAITLEVILRVVFGVEAERMEELREAMARLLKPMQVPGVMLLARLRRPSQRPRGWLGRTLDHLDELIYDELARRREQSDLEERTDVLSLLLLARDEQGRTITDAELRDELVTLLGAGHETTATALAWAIERLVRHPAKLARLIAEIDAGEGDQYMQAVIAETLRVRPVVPLLGRALTETLRVGAYELPAGTSVAASIYLAHRNERVYDGAREFRPERFLGNPPETFSWIPFGGGIRRCIGASFATFEMKVILRTVLSELEPELPVRSRWLSRAGERIRQIAVTLAPGGGTLVVWRTREPA